jgi:hypothetical protein
MRIVTTNVRLREDLHDQLKRIAEREHRSLNQEINYVLEQFVRRYTEEHPDARADRSE